jgi:hypothetical protein
MCKYCVCFRADEIGSYGDCREIKKKVKDEAQACGKFRART